MTRIPTFQSEEEEANFWAIHDFTDFVDDTEEIEIELAGALEDQIRGRYVLRLTSGQQRLLEAISERRGKAPQRIIADWVRRGLQRQKKLLEGQGS